MQWNWTLANMHDLTFLWWRKLSYFFQACRIHTYTTGHTVFTLSLTWTLTDPRRHKCTVCTFINECDIQYCAVCSGDTFLNCKYNVTFFHMWMKINTAFQISDGILSWAKIIPIMYCCILYWNHWLICCKTCLSTGSTLSITLNLNLFFAQNLSVFAALIIFCAFDKKWISCCALSMSNRASVFITSITWTTFWN